MFGQRGLREIWSGAPNHHFSADGLSCPPYGTMRGCMIRCPEGRPARALYPHPLYCATASSATASSAAASSEWEFVIADHSAVAPRFGQRGPRYCHRTGKGAAERSPATFRQAAARVLCTATRYHLVPSGLRIGPAGTCRVHTRPL